VEVGEGQDPFTLGAEGFEYGVAFRVGMSLPREPQPAPASRNVAISANLAMFRDQAMAQLATAPYAWVAMRSVSAFVSEASK
jgi:hypothetical protein